MIWKAGDLIPGSAEAVARLREAGERVFFLTNNSSATVGDTLDKLEGMGIPTEEKDLITSAQVAASMLEPGTTALVCGGLGVVEALEARGVRPVREGDADAVVVGWHRDFDFERLNAAFRAVRAGARLIATNDDATYPTPDGPVPGGGSLMAAVEYASGVEAEVAGKPNTPIVEMLHERVPDIALAIGDRPSTDGLLARRLEVPFVLALSGVTGEDHLPVEPEPDRVVADLATLVDQEYGE